MARDGNSIDSKRRTMLISASASLAAASLGSLGRTFAAVRTSSSGVSTWNPGMLQHMVPTASHEQFLIKCSFLEPLAAAPTLRVGDQVVRGQRTDSNGVFWQFHATGLKANTAYSLRLRSGAGRSLCSDWSLKTFPDPSEAPDRMRLLAYTCAGGPLTDRYLPLATRHRLMARAMSFAPDAVIANGDHIYWDLNPTMGRGRGNLDSPLGRFNRDEPVIGFENEQILKRVCEPQIAQVYGTRFRSTPMFFLADDHDYFQNDEANEQWITFPPENLELQLGRAAQHLYYPPFLRDAQRPLGLSGSSAADRAPGVSECFGTLRYGKLLEVLMYDCGRYLSLKDKLAGIVPPDAEQWLIKRTRTEDTQHLVHIPSTPFAWSAGKWREWYPDVLAAGTGEQAGSKPSLTVSREKYMWQRGWFEQHQRLMAALTSQRRPAIAMSGDLHACGWDRMLQSADLDMRRNAPYMLLHGTLGTGRAWPSAARGVPATAATGISLERGASPIEKNGFSIIDVTPEKITVRLFAWREPEPVEGIDTLEPFDVVEIRRN